jgi:hypothetical protein
VVVFGGLMLWRIYKGEFLVIKLTVELREAAEAALGWMPEDEQIENAVAEWEDTDAKTLRSNLARAVKAFEQAGGRGVEEADKIDNMRIAFAVRRIRP